jgi:hypothetical protein
MSTPPLAADRAEISRFVQALFVHADEGGFVSLRTFEHERGKPPVEIWAVRLNGEGLAPLVGQAARAATRAARHPKPAVFCPPICTFANGQRAAEADVLNGVALSVECDVHPAEARLRLEGLLGPATVTVVSGGTWTDPAGGEAQDKLHLHWRLAEPTRTPEEHGQLKRARRLAEALIGADPSAVPLVHPMRWPGSWHRKGAPKRCRIAEMHEEVEIGLVEASDRLEQAVMLALEHASGDQAARLRVALEQRAGACGSGRPLRPDLGARDADLEALADAILNDDAPRAEYVAMGLAFYAASAGSTAGFNAWDRWARKSAAKYHGGTARQWEHFAESPPDRTGKGALVERARRADPRFRLPSWGPERAHDEAEKSNSTAGAGPGPCGEAWPDPDLAMLSPHRRSAPELPVDVFDPFWSRWIADAAEAKGSPIDFVALPLIAAAGTLVANARRASPWSGWVEPPIIWAANVGLPSSNKSPGLDAVMDLVRELERELDADFDDRSRENLVARELAKAKRERWETDVRAALKVGKPPPEPPRDAEAPEPPARRRLYTNDPTTEQVARIASGNERGILLGRDELAGWFGQLDKYGGKGSDRALYLEAYGGRPYVIDRVKDGAAVRVPFLSVGIVGGIQPDRLASLLLTGDDDGAAARFLYAWPEPRRPQRPRRSPDDASALVAFRWLLTLGPVEVDGRKGPLILPFEPAAADDLQAWREQVAAMELGAAGLFLSWLGKLPGMAVRLALVFELLGWAADAMSRPEPSSVSRQAMLAALRFLEVYAVPMARRVFGEAALPLADRDGIALARWLQARAPVPAMVNARDLRHADALPTRKAERYDRALAELEAAGWVRPAPRRPGPGRGRKDWLVSPKLREVGA